MANKKYFPFSRVHRSFWAFFFYFFWCQEHVQSVEYRALGVFSCLFSGIFGFWGSGLVFGTGVAFGAGGALDLCVCTLLTSEWSCFFSEPTRAETFFNFHISHVGGFDLVIMLARLHPAPSSATCVHYVYELLISFLLISHAVFCSSYNGRPFGAKCLLKMI